MSSYTIGDDALQCHIKATEDNVWLSLEWRHENRSWGPAPLATAELFNHMQRSPEFHSRLDVTDVMATDMSVRVEFTVPNRRTSFTLDLVVDSGELVIRMDIANVHELEPELFRLFGVELLGGMMRVDGEGRMILPLNCGIRVRPADKPKLCDRFLLYGEQPRWQLMPILPIVGAYDADGGMTALATGGAADTLCTVRTDGEGAGEVSLGFSLRRYWPDPVDPATREVRFGALPGEGDPLHEMAARMRRHAVEDLGKTPLVERTAECPALANVMDGYIVKLFHATLTRGALVGNFDSNPPDLRYLACLTFAESIDCLKKLHDAGVRNVNTQSVGWYPDGHDAMFPTRFPIDERLGGEAGFRQLIDAGRAMGYQICLHDNFHHAYEASPDFTWETTIFGVYGEPLAKNLLAGGINRMQWPLAYPDGQITNHLHRLKDMGVDGLVFCDGLGNPAEVNYHPDNGGPRGDFVRGMQRIMDGVKSVFGTVQSETAFAWAAIGCDVSNHDGVGLRSARNQDWPISQLLDEEVQLFKLAFHGLTCTENHGESWPTTMRGLLYAEVPRCEFSMRPTGVVPAFSDDMVRRVAARYDLLVKQFGHLKLQRMVRWSQPTENVEQTVYEDGTEITADFQGEELLVNGQPVPRID